MSDLFFDPNISQMQRMVNRVSVNDLQKQYGLEHVYQLHQNENPYGPSPKAIEKMHEVATSLSYYPDFSDSVLREAIANTLADGITADHIVTASSGSESLELITRGFLREGDEVILSTPTFSGVYNMLIGAQGATVVDVPLVPETFAYDVEGVLNAITPRTKMIMVCNPNNPTGTVMPAEKMQQLVDGVPSHVLVVADEVYHHFVEDDAFPNSMQYVLQEKNVIVVHSFSKAYGLASMRLGYCVARPQIAEYLAKMQRPFHQNKVVMVVGAAACEDQDYLRKTVEKIKATKAWMRDQFDRLDIRYWPSGGNFYLFETPIHAEELTASFQERGIMLRPQHVAGMPNRVRVTMGTDQAMRLFIDTLESILSKREPA